MIPSLDRRWGGPVSVVLGLLPPLMAAGVECSVVCTRGPITGQPDLESLPHGATVATFDTDWLERIWIAHAPTMATMLVRHVSSADVVHIHELWNFPHWAAHRIAARAGVPYIISAHGQLEPWALHQKRIAKAIYAPLLLRPSLRGAAGVQALSAREQNQIRRFGFAGRTWVVPNGVPADTLASEADASRAFARFPQLRGKQVVLSVGRLDPQKGTDILIEAFGEVVRSRPTAHLLLVGPGRGSFARRLRRQTTDLGVAAHVTFGGPLFGRDQQAARAAATLFVSASRSEGQSVAVLEAMAASLPVIVTDASNVPDVVAAGAGALTALEPRSLSATITRLLDDEAGAKQMGSVGRDLVVRYFTWPTVASEVVKMYETVARKRAQ